MVGTVGSRISDMLATRHWVKPLEMQRHKRPGWLHGHLRVTEHPWAKQNNLFSLTLFNSVINPLRAGAALPGLLSSAFPPHLGTQSAGAMEPALSLGPCKSHKINLEKFNAF